MADCTHPARLQGADGKLRCLTCGAEIHPEKPEKPEKPVKTAKAKKDTTEEK